MEASVLSFCVSRSGSGQDLRLDLTIKHIIFISALALECSFFIEPVNFKLSHSVLNFFLDFWAEMFLNGSLKSLIIIITINP